MKLYPATLRGCVTPPQSKSILHRELICQALCGIYPSVPDAAGDVQMTQSALAALRDGRRLVDCGESGSTLRFLLPVAAAMGKVGTVFTGSPRLLQRPVPAGLPIVRTASGWRICDALNSGEYVIDASRTSQVVSGLLMALPLTADDSVLRVKAPVSRGYVELTISVLHRYGIAGERWADGYRIPGGQVYRAAPLQTEADWSAVAWYAAVNALGHQVYIKQLNNDSDQPDRVITEYLKHLPEQIDISQTPDLFPVLALFSALQEGKSTAFIHCASLRGKESDRLHNVTNILTALGVRAEETMDSLRVYGQAKLRGGAMIDPCGDHRMAFLAAFGALFCDSAVTLTDADCVKKSYPRFWEDYTALGGHIEE